MSYTEIFKFNNKGELQDIGDITNSHRGASAVWRAIEGKYLPMLPRPRWMNDEDYRERGHYRCHLPCDEKEKGEGTIWEVWDLFNSPKLSRIDKIVLGSTFDRVTVKKENISELILAFNQFEFTTSLPEQASLIKEHLDTDEGMIAIAWNQTSICGAFWVECNYDEESEGEDIPPYNYLTQSEHWDLFEAID